MTSVRHNGKTLLMTILAIGCMALVLLWPQWRDEVRAHVSDGQETSCFCEVFCKIPLEDEGSISQRLFAGNVSDGGACENEDDVCGQNGGTVDVVHCSPIDLGSFIPDDGCLCEGYCVTPPGQVPRLVTRRVFGPSSDFNSCSVDTRSACLGAKEKVTEVRCQ
jgi:hypothetical protein